MATNRTARTPPDAPTTALDRLAFERTARTRQAMDPNDSPHYVLEAFHAAGTALTIAPRLEKYRKAMAKLWGFDLVHLDRLPDLARALRFCQTEIVRRAARVSQRPELLAEGYQLRGRMLAYAEALTYSDRFEAELVARVRQGSGQRDLVEDLIVLSDEFLRRASVIGPETPVTRENLERAAEIAHELNLQVGQGAELDLPHSKLLDERRKLGGLLLRSHDELRRAMTYLRWRQGDAAKLVPSLHVPSGARRAADPSPEPQPEAEATVEPEAEEPEPPLRPDEYPFVLEEE